VQRRGDINLAARNAFGTTPINPPTKVGIARPESSAIQTIAATPNAVASCVSRMLRTVRMHLSAGRQKPRAL
jgi:hypothetical protein